MLTAMASLKSLELKTTQEVQGDLKLFECWQCDERSNIA
jgi:hypothetical protein